MATAPRLATVDTIVVTLSLLVHYVTIITTLGARLRKEQILSAVRYIHVYTVSEARRALCMLVLASLL